MHMAKRRTLIFSILLIAGLLAVQGCSANGYITASVQSVIGLDVSENPQTQVPHVRFGFIRNQLYYVPTGKVGNTSGDASQVPHLVSSIKLDSTFAQSMKIEENFAVGDEAIKSPAAHALFGAPAVSVPEVQELRESIFRLMKTGNNTQKAKEWIAKYKGETNIAAVDPNTFVMMQTDPKVLADLKKALE
ncbi:MAG: hypothetical protein ACHQ2F_07300 [Desulfobaccales bacterium]